MSFIGIVKGHYVTSPVAIETVKVSNRETWYMVNMENTFSNHATLKHLTIA